MHLAPRKIAKQIGISRSSKWRMVKKETIQALETPQVSERTRNRRENCAVSLRGRFGSHIVRSKNGLAR